MKGIDLYILYAIMIDDGEDSAFSYCFLDSLTLTGQKGLTLFLCQMI